MMTMDPECSSCDIATREARNEDIEISSIWPGVDEGSWL